MSVSYEAILAAHDLTYEKGVQVKPVEELPLDAMKLKTLFDTEKTPNNIAAIVRRMARTAPVESFQIKPGKRRTKYMRKAYFRELEPKLGRTFTMGQKLWYGAMRHQHQDAVLVIGDCFFWGWVWRFGCLVKERFQVGQISRLMLIIL